jgi:cell wall-associated NlpC family hydrolase
MKGNNKIKRVLFGGLLGVLLVGIGCLLTSHQAGAANRYRSSAVAGIAFDIDNYIANLSDDDLGAAVDLSQLALTSAGEEAVSYPEYAGKCMAVVDNSLNVRETASTDGAIIGKMVVGSLADVVEKGDAWTLIHSGNVEGYVSNDYLVFDDDAGAYAQQVCTTIATVEADVLMVREEPDTNASILDRAVQNQDLTCIEEAGDWVHVSLENGTVGYVSAEYVNVHFGTKTAYTIDELSSTKRMQVVNYALQFVGNPYVWGGTSLTNGTDCSGFVMRVYQNFGYSLNRSSRAQYSNGVPVSIDELQPGDLVFYAYSNGTIHHVALYIGNGQIVHACDSRTGIIVSNVYYNTPYGARRIITD